MAGGGLERPFALPPSLYLVLAATWTGGCAPWAARRPGTPERASRHLPLPYTTTASLNRMDMRCADSGYRGPNGQVGGTV